MNPAHLVDGELNQILESLWYDGFETANGVARNDKNFGTESEERSHDVAIAMEKIDAHLQAAVREAEAQMFHRIGDVLSWHVAQGNIEMKHRNLEQIMQQLNQGEK